MYIIVWDDMIIYIYNLRLYDYIYNIKYIHMYIYIHMFDTILQLHSMSIPGFASDNGAYRGIPPKSEATKDVENQGVTQGGCSFTKKCVI